MTDRELDDILYAALVVLNTPEYLELPDEPFPTSPEFEAKMENMMADPDGYVNKYRRAARPLWRKVLTAAAAVLLVLSVSLAGVMAVSPTARAWVERVVVEWLEEYVGIKVRGDINQVATNWRPTYLPDGFHEVFSNENVEVGYCTVVYENDELIQLDFNYIPAGKSGQFSIDREHSDCRIITINGHDGYLFETNIQGKTSFLIWSSSDKSEEFMLAGELDGDELFKIAESVEKN